MSDDADTNEETGPDPYPSGIEETTQGHPPEDWTDMTAISELRDARDALDNLIESMHRLQRIDQDTDDAELEIQTLIEHEFRALDDAIAELDPECESDRD